LQIVRPGQRSLEQALQEERRKEMKWAVISDIHANQNALVKVINHLQRQGVEGIISTGDVVVYGPRPNETVELLSSLMGEEWGKLGMMGNNDLSIVEQRPIEDASEDAQWSYEWTNGTISAENRQRLNKLSRQPIQVNKHLTIMHGTLLDPMGEFMYADMVDFTIKEVLRNLVTPLGIYGHTHKPAVYKAIPRPSPHIFKLEREYPQYGTKQGEAYYQVEFGEDFKKGYKLLICGGSVGQPRDRDPRAAYLILDDTKQLLQFHRIPYDIQQVQADLMSIGAPETIVKRLAIGG
jgi:predicted phosphodiesterase